MDDNRLTLAEIRAEPLRAARSVELPGGATALFRPLLGSDSRTLGAYFAALSPETRSLFGPHPFDQATADQLCAAAGDGDTLRMVALSANGEQIIAYFILMLLVTEYELERYARLGIALDTVDDCTVAPSVADARQNTGLGSPLFGHVIDLARRLGRRRMVLLGGTMARNERAIHFYQKHGFRTVGPFEYPAGALNYDMLLELYS